MRHLLFPGVVMLAACANTTPIGAGGSGGDSSATNVGGYQPDTTITSAYGGGSYGGSYGYGGSSYGGSGGFGESFCGDGVVTGSEECDDGNDTANDGCTDCQIDCEASGIKDPSTGHCYRIFSATTTWPAAESNCEAWGGASGLGHLVSIGDAGEQSIVAGLVDGVQLAAWIGATDTKVIGTFAWYDGTPFVYTNWEAGKPDGPDTQNCVYFHLDGGWDDHACGDLEPAYVCERRGAGSF